MNDETLKEVTEIATQIAIEICEQKKEEWLHKQQEYNIQRVKKILREYKVIEHYTKEHPEQLQYITTILQDDEVCESAESIVGIKERFDTALRIFKNSCFSSRKPEEERRYHIISELYLNCDEDKCNYLRGEDKISKLAQKYHINERTVYKDINKASSVLAALYFGILN